MLVAETAAAENRLPHPQQWLPVNDGVMGGLSQSRYYEQAGYAGVFAGNVSLENNGGFASVRAPMRLEPAAHDLQLHLKISGDGKRYSLRLLTERTLDGIAYAATINTVEGQISEHHLAAADFTAVWRGRVVSGAPPLQWQDVRQIGLMISEKQEGAFQLRLLSLDCATEPK